MTTVKKPIDIRTREYLAELGVDLSILETRNLPSFEDAQQLVIADVGLSGRQHLLVPAAASAWVDMKSKARSDGVVLLIVSAFRSFERQLDLLRSKLEQGCDVETLFLASAPPGHSEHHTGRAVDIGTPDCEPLTKGFEETPAFSWLHLNANRFGFRLSYPESNEFGFCYEPWHWCYVASDA